MGAKCGIMGNMKFKELANTRLGHVGTLAVVGAKDRETTWVKAKFVTNTNMLTPQGLIANNASPDGKVCTDGSGA